MKRAHLPVVAAALLCVLAVGLAAATVTNPVDATAGTQTPTEARDSGTTPFDFDIDGGSALGTDGSGGGHWTFTTSCIPFLRTPLFFGLSVAAFLGLFAGIRRRMATEYGLAAVAFLLPLFLFAHGTFTEDCGTETYSVPWEFPSGSAVNKTLTQATQPVSPDGGTPVLAVLVGGLFLLLVVAALATTVRQQSDYAEPSEEHVPDATHDLAGVADVAGEAADRIEDTPADATNEIYRAWQEMTQFLDVPDRDTVTPAEFRDAARDAGMAPAHVRELTDLFREVRYGGAEPTADREERAVAALRAIEDAYGDGGDRA